MTSSKAWVVGLIVLFILPGCHRRARAPRTMQPAPVAPGPRNVARKAVDYRAAAPVHLDLERWLVAERLFEPIAEMVSNLVVLPRSLSYVVEECDDWAFYSPRRGAIVICYAYVDFVRNQGRPAELRAALSFTVLHEVAHALIHELRLPILGREEDAADRFAATFLLAYPGPEPLVVPAALFFQRLAAQHVPSVWDEHLTDGQRFADLVCLASGAGPGKAGALERQLPAERRGRCVQEYTQARDGWDRLLAPHSRVVGGETFWPRDRR